MVCLAAALRLATRAAAEAVAGKVAELVVAGGIGLAPLRPAILALLAAREHYGRIVILYGARTPDEILFRRAGSPSNHPRTPAAIWRTWCSATP